MRKPLLSVMFLCLTCLVCSESWAGIGVYEVSLTGNCPYQITYLLNKDATSVTVEIVRSSDGWVAKSWSFVTPDPQCTKGMHSDLQWDPASQNPVPPTGNYKVRVSATGAAVFGPGDPPDNKLLVPLWERLNPDGTSEGWRAYGIAINRDPNSELYGRIYVSNYSIAGGKAKGVYEFYADGTLKGMLPAPTQGWGGSAPWGLDFDEDNNLYIEDRTNARYFQYKWDGTSWVQTETKLCQQGRGIAVTGKGETFRIAETYFAPSVPPSTNTRIAFGKGATPAPPNIRSPLAYGAALDDTFIGACFVGKDLYIAGAVGGGIYPETGEISVWDTDQMIPWQATPTRYPQYSRATGIDIYDGTVWLARIAGMIAKPPDESYNYTDPRDTDIAHQTVYKFPLSEIATIDPYNNPPSSFKTYGVDTQYTGNKWPYFVKADPVGNVLLTGGHTTIIGTNAVFFGLYEEPLGIPTSHSTTSRMEIYWPGEYVPVFISGGAVPGDAVANPIIADGTTPTRITVVAEDRNNTPTVNDIASVRIHCPSLGWGVVGDPATGWPMTLRSRDGYQNTYWNDATVARYSAAGWHTVKVYMYDVHYPQVPVQEGSFQIYVTGGKISGRITEGYTGYPAENITVKCSVTDAYGTWTTEAVTDANGDYVIDATEGASNVVYPAQQPDEVYSGKTYPGVTYPAEFNVANAHGATGSWPDNLGETDWPKSNISVTLGEMTTGVDGRVWPLVATQVVYKWSVGQYRPGGRTVCAMGIVTRQAADPSKNRKGFNGYYFIGDTKMLGVNMGVKVNVRAGDPDIVELDRVVVIGTYDKASGYSAGVVTPTLTPVVLSHNNAQLPVRTMDRGQYFTGNVLYSYYRVLDAEVTAVDPENQHFTVKLPYDGYQALCDVDTLASTGIVLPQVGDRVDMYCILDQHEPGARALRPGKPGDVHVIPIASELGIIKRASDGTAIFNSTTNPLVVTYVDVGDIGGYDAGKWFWVEQLNKTTDPKAGVSGLKVYTGATAQYLPPELQIGDTITYMKGQLNSSGTAQNDYMDRPRELQLTEMPSVGQPTSVPSFLEVTVKSFGGGWLSDVPNPGPGQGTPPVIDQIEPLVFATGLNTEGVLVKVVGKVVGYGWDPNYRYMWCWIDDGSGTVSDVSADTDYPPNTRMTGVKCVRLYNMFENWPRDPSDIGRMAVVTGLCTNKYVSGTGRIRMLHMRCLPGTGGAGLDQLEWVNP
ncbi:MAG: hypothetical protein ACUVT8_07315 [Armatimonadota bacterium]